MVFLLYCSVLYPRTESPLRLKQAFLYQFVVVDGWIKIAPKTPLTHFAEAGNTDFERSIGSAR